MLAVTDDGAESLASATSTSIPPWTSVDQDRVRPSRLLLGSATDRPPPTTRVSMSRLPGADQRRDQARGNYV